MALTTAFLDFLALKTDKRMELRQPRFSAQHARTALGWTPAEASTTSSHQSTKEKVGLCSKSASNTSLNASQAFVTTSQETGDNTRMIISESEEDDVLRKQNVSPSVQL